MAAIEACKKGKQWALAVSLLREMSTTPVGGQGTVMVMPTVEAYTAALSACGNAGQWEMAVGLLREVTDGLVVPAPVPPAAPAAAAAAPAVSNVDEVDVSGRDGAGSVGEAVDSAHCDGGGGVDVGAELDARGDAAGREREEGGGDGGVGVSGDGPGQQESLLSSSPSPLAPAPKPLTPDVFLYNAAIEACGTAGEWQRALELLSEISHIGLSPSVVSDILVVFLGGV